MTESDSPRVPPYHEFMNPVLEALRHSGALSIKELDHRVLQSMALPQDVVVVPHDPSRPDRSEVSYRIAWARSYLKKVGLLDNPSRGHWAASEKGKATPRVDPSVVITEVARALDPHEVDRSVKSDLDEDERNDLVRSDSEAGQLDEAMTREFLSTRDSLMAEGALLARPDVERILSRFRERFGPEALARLDGEALLERMHGRTSRDSLAYWLEFKDDADFPNVFGSISGGSAYKFGIFQTADTNVWMGGSGQQPRPFSLEEAIEKARSQRDQFIAGERVLRAWTSRGEVDYLAVQREVEAAAPELAETAWGHKYFSLLVPNLIDPNHGRDYQHFQIIKLHKLPLEGRYENARHFAHAARQLGMTLIELSTVLYRRNGSAHGYWRVGTTVDGESEWPRMLAGNFIAVGWDELPDLSNVPSGKDGRDALREFMAERYPKRANVVTRSANEVFNFVQSAKPRDLVVAMDGATVCGIGRITGPYFFRAGDGPCPHRRPVDWLSETEWRLPVLEGLRTTFTRLGKKEENLIEIERHLRGDKLETGSARPQPRTRPVELRPPPSLSGIPARIDAVLQRKRQVILYGPPGTGKTYWAERTAEELAARSWFDCDAQSLDASQRESLEQSGAIEMCAFHAAYGYEDFLEGYRPTERDGALAFQVRDGIFKRLCERARNAPDRAFFLIIDEINRGDIPRIFGELLTVLEKDKRNREVTLPLTGKPFSVPDNVHLVGTMNTADRSIALLDAALRRRFGFIELLPDSTMLRSASVEGLPLGPWLDELNRRIVQHVGRDGRSLQIGHSYLLLAGAPVREISRFAEILRDDIFPLLEEYCYEDFDALERILGGVLVQRAHRRFDERLFLPDRRGALIQALLNAFPEITATREAVEADRNEDEPGDEDSDSNDEAAA